MAGDRVAYGSWYVLRMGYCNRHAERVGVGVSCIGGAIHGAPVAGTGQGGRERGSWVGLVVPICCVADVASPNYAAREDKVWSCPQSILQDKIEIGFCWSTSFCRICPF
jgi:hypothetical protein